MSKQIISAILSIDREKYRKEDTIEAAILMRDELERILRTK